ncbi:hypothetical protein HK097_000667 [Rhizophlyctis rosea]|uniref:Ankyrin n=1 Tax=Rhizophlyctis rosea TaxID=64517 RepID=A0AAD5WYQ4_9FUNG|nr:hypothetical protein HK097_000667 [Rhizophlyctis rosea]
MPKLTIQIPKPKQDPRFPVEQLAVLTRYCDARTASRLRQLSKAATVQISENVITACFIRSLAHLNTSDALVRFYGAHVPRMTNKLPLATKILRSILRNGATLHSSLPLVNAVIYHHIEAIPLLLASNVSSQYIDEALVIATQYRRRLAIQPLLASNCSTEGREAALAAAVSSGDEIIVHTLLGDDLSKRQQMSRDGALCEASKNGNVDMVQLLMKERIITSEGCGQALCAGSQWGYIDCVQLLLESGIAFNDEDGSEALRLAVTHGHETIADLLLKFGVDPLAVPKDLVSQRKFRRVAAKQRQMRVTNWFGRWMPAMIRV